MMINDGMPVSKVSRFMGHADVETTMKWYTRAREDELGEVADAWGTKGTGKRPRRRKGEGRAARSCSEASAKTGGVSAGTPPQATGTALNASKESQAPESETAKPSQQPSESKSTDVTTVRIPATPKIVGSHTKAHSPIRETSHVARAPKPTVERSGSIFRWFSHAR